MPRAIVEAIREDGQRAMWIQRKYRVINVSPVVVDSGDGSDNGWQKSNDGNPPQCFRKV